MRASWCQRGFLVTEFSIRTSQPLKILIFTDPDLLSHFVRSSGLYTESQRKRLRALQMPEFTNFFNIMLYPVRKSQKNPPGLKSIPYPNVWVKQSEFQVFCIVGIVADFKTGVCKLVKNYFDSKGSKMRPLMTKTTTKNKTKQTKKKKNKKMTVRPAKTQISLGTRPVWSVFAVRSVGS